MTRNVGTTTMDVIVFIPPPQPPLAKDDNDVVDASWAPRNAPDFPPICCIAAHTMQRMRRMQRQTSQSMVDNVGRRRDEEHWNGDDGRRHFCPSAAPAFPPPPANDDNDVIDASSAPWNAPNPPNRKTYLVIIISAHQRHSTLYSLSLSGSGGISLGGLLCWWMNLFLF